MPSFPASSGHSAETPFCLIVEVGQGDQEGVWQRYVMRKANTIVGMRGVHSEEHLRCSDTSNASTWFKREKAKGDYYTTQRLGVSAAFGALVLAQAAHSTEIHLAAMGLVPSLPASRLVSAIEGLRVPEHLIVALFGVTLDSARRSGAAAILSGWIVVKTINAFSPCLVSDSGRLYLEAWLHLMLAPRRCIWPRCLHHPRMQNHHAQDDRDAP